MRRILTSLAGFCVFAVVALAAPQARAQQGPTDLTELYHNWQQTQDPEQIIALGEQLLALEPSATTWPLTVERSQVKAEVQFGVGSAYVARQRGIRSENLEKAIAHLQAALIVFTRGRRYYPVENPRARPPKTEEQKRVDRRIPRAPRAGASP
jgi:hypothetical protein